MVHESFTNPYKRNMTDYKKKPIWNLTGRIKMMEIEYGRGPLKKDPTREHGHHPTLEIFPIKKKVEIFSSRYISRLERGLNIHNSLHPPHCTS